MSVTLRTSVTSNPRYVIHRRSWSYTSAERRWPMCGDDWTVGPHTYMPTSPSRSGTKSRRAPAFVSKSRRVTPTSLEGAGLRRGALGELLVHRRERGAVEQQLDVRDAALADGQQLDAAHRPRGGVGDEIVDDAGTVARTEHLADLVAHQGRHQPVERRQPPLLVEGRPGELRHEGDVEQLVEGVLIVSAHRLDVAAGKGLPGRGCHLPSFPRRPPPRPPRPPQAPAGAPRPR